MIRKLPGNGAKRGFAGDRRRVGAMSAPRGVATEKKPENYPCREQGYDPNALGTALIST